MKTTNTTYIPPQKGAAKFAEMTPFEQSQLSAQELRALIDEEDGEDYSSELEMPWVWEE